MMLREQREDETDEEYNDYVVFFTGGWRWIAQNVMQVM